MSFDIFAIGEFGLGSLLTFGAVWFVWAVRKNHKVASVMMPVTEVSGLHLHPWLGDIELPEPKIDPESFEICATCGLSFKRADYEEHLRQTKHGKKIVDEGVDFKSKTHRLVVVRLKPGEALPTDLEHERPISVQVEGNELVYHYYRTGLKRIK